MSKSKLLVALALALNSASALAVPDSVFKEWINANNSGWVNTAPPPPEGVDPVWGGRFYIVDPSAPVEFTFVTTHAGHTLVLSVGSLDESGRASDWQRVFTKTGNSVGASASYTVDPGLYNSYTSGEAELIFQLYDVTTDKTYYSGLGSANSATDGVIHAVSYSEYYQGKTLVGFEDLDASVSDWDYDDLVFLVSNVSNTPSVPEPETYAMMLAGIGLLGAVARRRRARRA